MMNSGVGRTATNMIGSMGLSLPCSFRRFSSASLRHLLVRQGSLLSRYSSARKVGWSQWVDATLSSHPHSNENKS